MTKSQQDAWINQRGCLACLEEIMQGFLQRQEKTNEEVSKLMAKVPAIWEPINAPEDSHVSHGAEMCPSHHQQTFDFAKYIKL